MSIFCVQKLHPMGVTVAAFFSTELANLITGEAGISALFIPLLYYGWWFKFVNLAHLNRLFSNCSYILLQTVMLNFQTGPGFRELLRLSEF
jgi:hypothetical protein